MKDVMMNLRENQVGGVTEHLAYEKPVVSVRDGLVEMVPDECY